MEGDDEHPSSSLGHSEVLSVENAVGPPVPELRQATEERPKVFAAMTGEESRYILEEDGGRSVLLHKGKEGEGEAAAGGGVEGWPARIVGTARPVSNAGPAPWADHIRSDCGLSAPPPVRDTEACPLACDGEILARKTAGPEGSPMPLPTRRVGLSLTVILVPPVESNDIAEVRDSGPSLGEDGAGVGVDLREADGSPAGTFKPKVD